jgi:hypothetical protein
MNDEMMMIMIIMSRNPQFPKGIMSRHPQLQKGIISRNPQFTKGIINRNPHFHSIHGILEMKAGL